MTQDEIIEMARDSGMELYGLGKNRERFVHHLKAFAKLVADKEREACAKICSDLADKALVSGDGDALNCFEEAEERIRARGEA